LFGVVAAPIAIAIVLYGGVTLAALLAIVAALGAWELFRIARAGGLAPFDDVGIACAGFIPLLVHYQPISAAAAMTLAIVVLLFLLALAIWLRGVEGKPLSAVAVTAFGAAYIGGTLSFAYAIRYHEYAFAPAPVTFGSRSFNVPSGGLLLLLPLFATWASDIGAYAVGRAIGRHKLIPSVSPGKTVEGALGGLIASMVLAWAYVQFVLRPAAHLGFKWSPLGVLVFGAAMSVAAQLGDLAESLLKREAGVKDSSTLLPGHGGILDRCDSLFFVLPLAYAAFGFLLAWAP
jgi:phosphatidate cytidylyltransferase